MEEKMKHEEAEAVDTEVAEDMAMEAETEAVEENEQPEAAQAEAAAGEEAPSEEVQAEDARGKEKSSFFKKKKDKKDEKIEELNDRLIRNMAEFENFRKRSEKEKAQMFEVGAKSIIEKILPVIDNFERGLGTLSEEERSGAFAQGIEQIYKQMMTALSEAGVTPIEAQGKEFDPNLHNAVMHGEDDTMGENVVAEELLKGYMYRESVVRHSMVKVVN